MTIGIKDVAQRAGVSVATVSRVFSNGPVSAALRQKVELAARETGYRPNLSARRLRSRHSGTIGLIVSDIGNPFFTAVGRAVESAAYDAGMRVILCNTDENPDKEALYLQLMQEERVTGLIFAPTSTSLARLGREKLDFPVVLIDRAGPPGLYDAVVLDNAEASARLVEHLRQRGHDRIGGLFGNTSSTGRERAQGYENAMTAAGLTAQARFIAPRSEAATAALRQWLDEADAPSAFIASNGQILLGMMRAVRQAGLPIRSLVALAGFDNEPWTELVDDGISVIEQPVNEMGYQAMALLFSRLQSPEQPVRKVILSGQLIARGVMTAPLHDPRHPAIGDSETTG